MILDNEKSKVTTRLTLSPSHVEREVHTMVPIYSALRLVRAVRQAEVKSDCS